VNLDDVAGIPRLSKALESVGGRPQAVDGNDRIARCEAGERCRAVRA
jgi:hypothetical protein